MEAMEEILPPLQHQLQGVSPPPKVQLGQQDQQQREVARQDGLLTGIVMTSTTIWNVPMMVETAVDLMWSPHGVVYAHA